MLRSQSAASQMALFGPHVSAARSIFASLKKVLACCNNAVFGLHELDAHEMYILYRCSLCPSAFSSPVTSVLLRNVQNLILYGHVGVFGCYPPVDFKALGTKVNIARMRGYGIVIL